MSSLKLPLRISNHVHYAYVADNNGRVLLTIHQLGTLSPDQLQHRAKIIKAALEADAEEENTDG